MVPIECIDLGRAPFAEAYAWQLARLAARQQGEVGDAIAIVEHPHVITVGRSQGARANLLAPGEIAVVEIERGGDVTYHGPGQLVAYPIVALGDGERDLHRFLRLLEDAIIATLARFALATGREPGKTGVWLDGRKLASIGIACRRWVMFHGLALNVATDLAYFTRINPCGFDAGVMTSMSKELGRAITVAEVKPVLVAELARALGRALA